MEVLNMRFGKDGRRYYKTDFKIRAINEYEKGGKSYTEVCQEMGIPNVFQLKQWRKKYKQEGIDGLRQPGTRKKFKGINEEIKYLRMENELLKKYLAELGYITEEVLSIE